MWSAVSESVDPALPELVIDTDVWSALYANYRAGSPEVMRWREIVSRVRVPVIATQTRAEVLSGLGALGPRRAAQLREQLGRSAEYPVTDAVVEAYATLFHQAKLAGHPLHQKIHTGDRWIAATAIALDVPLLSADRMFEGAPRLHVVDWWSVQT